MDQGWYLFASETGDMLPRWRDAFPSARSVSWRAAAASGPAPAMVWLRLSQALPVAEQLASARLRFGQAPIVVLSDTPSDDEGLAAFSAAAKGYCNAHATTELLKQVEAVVLAGGLWIGETLIHRLLGALSKVPEAPEPPDEDWTAALTEREREVALIVCAGASNKEIARKLGITERTVKAHVGAIFEKLGLHDRVHLALLSKGLARPRVVGSH